MVMKVYICKNCNTQTKDGYLIGYRGRRAFYCSQCAFKLYSRHVLENSIPVDYH